MKRIICFSLIFLVLLTSGITASAQNLSPQGNILSSYEISPFETRIDYGDGSYSIISIAIDSARSTKTETKSHAYYSSDNVLQWVVKVKGTFTYNGTTSSCSSASHTITIYNNAWYTYSQNSYASGNKAIANVVMKKKHLGIVVATQNVNLELACDKNGNLS